MKIVVLYCGSSFLKAIMDSCINAGASPIALQSNTPVEIIAALEPSGIIITGSGRSVLNRDAPKVDQGIYGLDIPILGICYGMQRMAVDLGGKVQRTLNDEKDDHVVVFWPEVESALFNGIAQDGGVFHMNHSCSVVTLPPDFYPTARTEQTEFAAMEKGKLFATQFHPEKQGSGAGKQVLNNFLDICSLPPQPE